MEQPIELLFATGNLAKLEQLAFVIEAVHANVRLVAARDRFGEQAIYGEVGSTASAVALRGATDLAERLHIPVAVEDTAFHVDALNGEPGVHAGTYLRQVGREWLLHRLADSDLRRATIVSAVAWAAPDGRSQVWTTAVDGTITRSPVWTAGQPSWVGPSPGDPLGGGYNAIFVPYGESHTLAEIGPVAGLQWGYREPNFCALLRFLEEHRHTI